MTIERNHVFLGKNSTKKFLSPFDKLSTKPVTIKIEVGTNLLPVNQHIIPSLLRATLTVIDAETNSDADSPLAGLGYEEHFAAGTANTGEEFEEIFIEWQAKGDNRIEIAAYNPNDGKIRCCLWNELTNASKKYRFTSPSEDDIGSGTAIWIAVLLHAKSTFKTISDLYEQIKELISYCGTVTDEELVALYCYEFFNRLTSNSIEEKEKIKLNLPEQNLPVPELKKLDIESNAACPSKGKSLYSFAYKVFDVEVSTSESKFGLSNIDFNKYLDMNWEHKTLSQVEEMMVPKLPEDNVMSKEVVDILEEMYQTKDNSPATRTMHILLEGDAGSGKSHSARVLAAILHRPYLTYVCSSTDDKDSLLGTLLPYVDENESEYISAEESDLLKIVRESSEEDLIENACMALSLPGLTDCFYDPEGIYEELTGNTREGVTPQDAYALLTSKVLKTLKDVCENAVKKAESHSSKSDTSSVKYRYIPSTIVQALKNGYFLELQEPTCVSNPSAFACLYDAFERDSVGVVNTVCGDVYRHPDFVLVGTTNRRYAGLKELNPALRSRFHIFKAMDMPSKDVLIQRLMKKTKMADHTLARNIVDCFLLAAEKATDNSAGEATMRALYRFGDAVHRGKNAEDAFNTYLLWSITTSPEEAQEICDAVEECELFRN